MEHEHWDLIIKPRRSILDFNILEIWKYRDLILLFVRRDFISKYKQTVLGPLWFLIQPILTTLMLTVIFHSFAGIPTDGLPPILFYMTGIVAWIYFSTCLTVTSNTFISNAHIFGKVYFPRLIIPISIILSNLIQFGIQAVMLLGFILYFYLRGAAISITGYVFLVPLLILLLAMMALGFGIIISSLTTKYRDLSNLVAFGVQLWMFFTPVIYPLSNIPDQYRIIIAANPVTPIIEAFRLILLGTGNVTFIQMVYSSAFTLIILALGILMFNRVEKSVMDVV